jgi:cyanate lyase
MPRPISDELREQRQKSVEPLFLFMEERGIMQKWLADKLGVSKVMITYYKTGEAWMPKAQAKKACQLLGFPESLLPLLHNPTSHRKKGA